MNINMLAKITKISVRTLQHYDNIGLLSPSRNRENSYREYSNDDINILQQILAFKRCGFSLSEIKRIIYFKDFDRLRALELQMNYLNEEKKKIDSMLVTLEKTKREVKGEIKMENKEKFVGFDFSTNPYEGEARKLWGDKAVDESQAHIGKMNDTEKSEMADEMNEIFRKFSAHIGDAPDSAEVQNLVEKFYNFLNTKTGHKYSHGAFKGLGEMYVADTRFTENIDKFGMGLSLFLSKAMAIYADKG